MKVNIIFDIGHIFYKSFSIAQTVKKDFSFEKENDKAFFVRKFFTDISAAINMFEKQNIENVFFCFDSHSFRKQISKKYKASRKQKEQAFYDTVNECEEILNSLNLNCLKVEGLEADDLVGLVAHSNKTNLNVIYSGDYDTHQLINNNTVVFNNLSKKKIIYFSQLSEDIIKDEILNYTTFLKFTNDTSFVFKKTNPCLVLLEKIFLGCEGDEVERLAPYGYGIKKIEKIVNKNNFDFINNYLPEQITHEDLIKICIQSNIEYSFDIMSTQMKLVCLFKDLLPEKSLDKFLSLQTKELPDIEFKMKNILKQTKYIHYL